MIGRRLAIALIALAAFATTPAQAQNFPAKPIRLIVPFAPGGVTDLLARLIGDHLEKTLNQRVLVENKTGAVGNLGLDLVAKSPPDGYTLALTNVGHIAINPLLIKDMPFDPATDLVPVASVAESVQMIAVWSKLPVNTLQELIAYTKANSGKLAYGSAGIGTTPHLAGDYFARTIGAEMIHVPYRGAGAVAPDLATGQIQVVFIAVGAYYSQWKSGAVRILAVAAPQRLAGYPELPTATEAGLPGFEFSTWYGVFGPKGTPEPALAALHGAISEMLDDPITRKRLADGGIEPIKDSRAGFVARIQRDAQKWRDIVKAANIKME
jgi:tripartite-type tricarboxylate transporter receptor subunit TctC